jgi:uncharacterized membrane protein
MFPQQLRSLAWKEWHENRAYLWIALGVFAGLPALGGIEGLYQFSHRFEIQTVPWIIAFGGVLAVFVATSAACRDFRGRLDDFWRSRPVGTWSWLLVKFIVGLVIVLLGCMIPAALQLAINREHDATPLLVWFPCLWAALYGISFLIGCLVRRTAPAAMLGLGAMLLVWFLPMVLPPLRWLDVTELTDDTKPLGPWQIIFGSRQYTFAGGTVAIAILALVVALLAVRREWRIASGKRMMFGSIAAAVLILFSSAAFQLGTNLPILAEAKLPPNEQVQWVRCQGTHGYLITMRQVLRTRPNAITHQPEQYIALDPYGRTFEVGAGGIELSLPTKLGDSTWYQINQQPRSPQLPTVRYYVTNADDETDNDQPTRPMMLRVAEADLTNLRTSVPLWTWENRRDRYWPQVLQWQDRLFVIGRHLMVFDVSQPLEPKPLSDVPFAYRPVSQLDDVAEYTLDLPLVPGLPARQRLELALRHVWNCSGLDGDLLCVRTKDVLLAFQLTDLTEASARLQRIGRYEPTMLERIFGVQQYGDLQLSNGLLYTASGRYWPGGSGINPHMSVFSIRPLRPIAHFAAPGAGEVCPLPDGRAIVAGNKLYLLGPPPRR